MQRNLFVAIFVAALLSAASVAQTAQRTQSGGPGLDAPPANFNMENDAAISQITRFGNYDYLKQRLKQSGNKGKTAADLLAQDKADAVSLVAASKLSCTVSDAILVAEDSNTHGKTYEVACDSGLGYFLVQNNPPVRTSGFSCFAAEATRAADIAAHREPALTCSLPQNAGSKAMASAIMTRHGKACVVRDTRWLGQSDVTHTDYLEVACEDATGFVLASPLPESPAQLRLDTCPEAARKGIACRLSDNGVTIQTFKNALVQHNIACDATNMRLIGQERLKHRHVVEFYCPLQELKGLVAFVPLEGAAAPFEVVDCEKAAQRGIICTLTKKK